ncbi:MAG: HAMP domain-containing sensor histidine kinase [Ketobacteraceae bacterium]|nr:HAMP domain-containing sensor histidine kinase [Ketobacteraceae bacterium]
MLKAARETLNFSVMQRWFIQAVFIVFAVLMSVVTVTWILEKSLVRQALELEADAFIAEYRKDPDFPLPRTRNLIGYLKTSAKDSHVPATIRSMKPGLYPEVEFDDRPKPVPVYIKDFDGNRLFLIFEGANVDRLVGIFGLVPLSFILIVIYTSSWIAYRITWRAASPIISLAQNIRDLDPDKSRLHLPVRKLTGDARELAMALEEYGERIDAFVERERQFTADVSHELRTPMTIIDGAAQFLATENNLSGKGVERVQMIRRASRDVNELISAFLLLAREQAPDNESVTNVATVVESEIIKMHALLEGSDIRLLVDIQHELEVSTPKKVLEIIIGNLCRNACKYTTEGEIRVTVSATGVQVADTGSGISEDLLPHLFERHVRGRGDQKAGEGIGLAIVKRLCDQFNWSITIENRPSGGVLVTLTPVEPAPL